MNQNAPKQANTKVRQPLLNNRLRAWAALLLVPACALLLFIFYPQAELVLHYVSPFCPLNLATGLNCVLCGGTRAARALSRLDFFTALYYNPFVLGLLVWFLVHYIRLFIACIRRPFKPFPLKIKDMEWYILLAVALAFMVVRNLPFYRAIFF